MAAGHVGTSLELRQQGATELELLEHQSNRDVFVRDRFDLASHGFLLSKAPCHLIPHDCHEVDCTQRRAGHRRCSG